MVAREASNSGAINECEEAGRRSQEAASAAGSAIAITEHVTIRVTSLSRNYSKAFKVKGMQALRKRVAAWDWQATSQIEFTAECDYNDQYDYNNWQGVEAERP